MNKKNKKTKIKEKPSSLKILEQLRKIVNSVSDCFRKLWAATFTANSGKETPVENEVAQPNGSEEEVKDEKTDEIKKLKEFYKEFIAIGKDTLEVTWKLSPLALIPPGLLLWVHLRSIGWTGLFQDSAMAVSGLVFLFIAALFLIFLVLVQFVFPSVVVISAVTIYSPDHLLPKHVASLYVWALIGWLFSIILMLLQEGIYSEWFLFGLPLMVSLISLLICLRKENDVSAGLPQLGWFIKNLGWPIAAAITVVATSIPLVLGLQIAEQVPDVDREWKSWFAVIVCCVASVVSLIPGFMYLRSRIANSGTYRAMKFAMIGFFFVSYIVTSVIAFFAPVSSTVLELADIYSNELRTYQIRDEKLTSAFKAAGLELIENEGITLVRAYLRYGFGGYKLLCKSEFKPASVSSDAVRKTKSGDKDPRFLAGSHCAPAYPNEVREIRL